MRLIDADELMKRYGDSDDVVETKTKGEWEVYVGALQDFFKSIDDAPTVSLDTYEYHPVSWDTTVAEIAQVTHLTVGEVRSFLQDVVDSGGEVLTEYQAWAEENA